MVFHITTHWQLFLFVASHYSKDYSKDYYKKITQFSVKGQIWIKLC